MKHFKLREALEKAKAAGLHVIRRHREGKTLVTIESNNGQACGKAYTIGNASGQASFINSAIKGFTLVETGTLYRYGGDVDVFVSDFYKTTYAWNHSDREWQAVHGFNPQAIKYQAPVILKVKVKCSKLMSGITHPEW